MTAKNRKDDLEIAVTIYDWKGEAIGVPDFDWVARFTTNGITHYDAQCVGGVYTNAYVKHDEDTDTDGIVCVLNDHGLGCGKLKCEFKALLPNSNYPDGNEVIYTPLISDIVLTDGESSKPSALDITATLPYIKGEQGDAMTWQKMSDSEKQEVVDGAVAKVQPQVDESLAKVQNDADAAISNLSASVANTLQEFESTSQEKIADWDAFTDSAKAAEQAREERSLSGSFSIDFGTEAQMASWFNVEGYKAVITAVQSANCASVTINGTADAVGIEIEAESVAVVEITRAADSVSAAVGVKYKLIKE